MDDSIDKINKFGEAADHFEDITIGIGLGVDTGAFVKDTDALEQGIDALIIQYDKMEKKDKTMEDLEGFKNMLKNIGTPEEWNQHSESIRLFNEYTKDNNLEPWEAAAINAQVAAEDLAGSTDEATTSTGALNEEQQKIADNNILARTVVQLTTDYNSQTTAVNALGDAYAYMVEQKNKYNTNGGNNNGGLQFVSGADMFYMTPEQQKAWKEKHGGIDYDPTFGKDTKGESDQSMTAQTTAAQTLQKALDSLKKYGIANLVALAKQSSTQMSGMAKNMGVGTTAVQTTQIAIGSLKKYGVTNLGALAKQSSTQMSGMSKNLGTGTEATQTLQTAIESLKKYGINNLKALAKASSTQMNGFVNNVEEGTQAVQDLQEAIDSLEDKTVNVTVNKQSKGSFGGFDGGGFNFAQGGLVESKAKGDVKTVNRPTLFLYGDNPGNRETLAFIPHNNPTPTLEKLSKVFGGEMANVVGGGKGGSVVHIHNHFLQREVQQVLNVERGRMISRMV